MKSFKQFIMEQQGQTDYQNLGYPPMASTAIGKYFLDVDGNIIYTIRSGDGQTQKGVTDTKTFANIYQKYYAQHIKPEDVKRFTDYYAKNMTGPEFLQSPANTQQSFPSIFNSPNAKWTSDGETVIWKINGKQGISTPQEFQPMYDKIKNQLGHNQAQQPQAQQPQAQQQPQQPRV